MSISYAGNKQTSLCSLIGYDSRKLCDLPCFIFLSRKFYLSFIDSNADFLDLILLIVFTQIFFPQCVSSKMSGFLDNCNWPKCDCIELGERRNFVASIISGVMVRTILLI